MNQKAQSQHATQRTIKVLLRRLRLLNRIKKRSHNHSRKKRTNLSVHRISWDAHVAQLRGDNEFKRRYRMSKVDDTSWLPHCVGSLVVVTWTSVCVMGCLLKACVNVLTHDRHHQGLSCFGFKISLK